jgi:hypothetical protein
MADRRHARAERAAIVGLVTGGARRIDAEHSLEELAGLAEAAGADVVLRVLQERATPDPATFLGRGKVDTSWRRASCANCRRACRPASSTARRSSSTSSPGGPARGRASCRSSSPS